MRRKRAARGCVQGEGGDGGSGRGRRGRERTRALQGEARCGGRAGSVGRPAEGEGHGLYPPSSLSIVADAAPLRPSHALKGSNPTQRLCAEAREVGGAAA